ncbi:TauD/TfdA family dioxygenase [Achromobacter anxifer]|uniref:TauD/TfdA family dioxygenase n=1 Tax=Achromobacter anxifer TaxID=1287737 RepID=UPI0023F99375|nr:TauD/TfdA family dioxygenase [Achromobacter anxifer]MDF8364743.1 TauD/TfdA family dioxygenase [Achromobacter anxifer]
MGINSDDIQVLTGPGVWSGAELNNQTDWIQHFDAKEVGEIDTMLNSLRDYAGDVSELTHTDFSLPLITRRCEAIRSELEGGRGFALIRGLPVDRYSLEDSRLIFWALAILLGEPQKQDKVGNRIHSVTNTNQRVEGSSDVRSYQTDDELTFHNDGGDAFMLLCLKTARSGGMSKLVSVEKLYNEVLQRRPDLIKVLQEPFHFDTREQHPTGLKVQTSPILNFFDGRLSALYKRRYLLAAQRFPEVPRLTPAQEEAIQLVETICNDPAVQLSFYMEPGDIQIANNYCVLHARSKYEDYEEPSARRHLFRAWLTLPNGRPLPPVFALTREFRTSYLSRHEVDSTV